MKPTYTQTCTLLHAVADILGPERAEKMIDTDRKLVAAGDTETRRVTHISMVLSGVMARESQIEEIARLMQCRRTVKP